MAYCTTADVKDYLGISGTGDPACPRYDADDERGCGLQGEGPSRAPGGGRRANHVAHPARDASRRGHCGRPIRHQR